MIRGFYTAASGLVTQEKKLNTYSNNMANVSTAGFKKDNLVAGTFGEHMAVRMNAYQQGGVENIGPGVFMQTVVDEYTDYTQGGFEQTNRPLDMAIAGQGFFVVADEESVEYLTRDGQFALDEDGYLILPGYGRVQGDGGDLEIGVSSFTVDTAGNIYSIPEEEDEDPELLARLVIAVPEDYTALSKAENGLFVAEGYDEADTAATQILQGVVEGSNVNLAEEMSRVIESHRALQSCSQILKMYDEMAEQSNTRISRV